MSDWIPIEEKTPGYREVVEIKLKDGSVHEGLSEYNDPDSNDGGFWVKKDGMWMGLVDAEYPEATHWRY